MSNAKAIKAVLEDLKKEDLIMDYLKPSRSGTDRLYSMVYLAAKELNDRDLRALIKGRLGSFPELDIGFSSIGRWKS